MTVSRVVDYQSLATLCQSASCQHEQKSSAGPETHQDFKTDVLNAGADCRQDVASVTFVSGNWSAQGVRYSAPVPVVILGPTINITKPSGLPPVRVPQGRLTGQGQAWGTSQKKPCVPMCRSPQPVHWSSDRPYCHHWPCPARFPSFPSGLRPQ